MYSIVQNDLYYTLRKREYNVAAQRLSKMQKWILINCYKITVLKERVDKELSRCEKFDAYSCRDKVKKIPDCYEYKCKTEKYLCTAFMFSQIDVYRNFYKMESSLKRQRDISDGFRFVHTSDSDKIYQTTFRSLRNLKEKGLIYYYKWECVTNIYLTPEGVIAAEKLYECSR